MELKKILTELSSAKGVSGAEDEAAKLAFSYIKKYTDDCEIKNGNVIASFGERKDGVPHILLDAHIDQIGLIVTYITDDGFLQVGSCGGIDRRLLLAQKVLIHGKEAVAGVICSIPPHLAKSGDEEKVPEFSEIYIDIGMSKAQAEEIISLGDKITFCGEAKELLGNKITGVALDDRAGVTALLYTAELLSGIKTPCSYTILFSTQEEIGERGAQIAAYEINPDIAVAVDVSFAMSAGEEPEKCGIMGKGGMIGISPSLSFELSEKLKDVAAECNIPYQLEIMGGLTSTNADRFSVTRAGVPSVTLSIPLRYMHTPVEIVDISDVEAVGRLLAEWLKREGI